MRAGWKPVVKNHVAFIWTRRIREPWTWTWVKRTPTRTWILREQHPLLAVQSVSQLWMNNRLEKYLLRQFMTTHMTENNLCCKNEVVEAQLKLKAMRASEHLCVRKWWRMEAITWLPLSKSVHMHHADTWRVAWHQNRIADTWRGNRGRETSKTRQN